MALISVIKGGGTREQSFRLYVQGSGELNAAMNITDGFPSKIKATSIDSGSNIKYSTDGGSYTDMTAGTEYSIPSGISALLLLVTKTDSAFGQKGANLVFYY